MFHLWTLQCNQMLRVHVLCKKHYVNETMMHEKKIIDSNSQLNHNYRAVIHRCLVDSLLWKLKKNRMLVCFSLAAQR